MLKDREDTFIGEIGNYYGGLVVKCENGVPMWSITNYDGDHWEEMPVYVYKAMISHYFGEIEE